MVFTFPRKLSEKNVFYTSRRVKLSYWCARISIDENLFYTQNTHTSTYRSNIDMIYIINVKTDLIYG